MRQVHGQKVCLLLDTGNHHYGLTKVGLGMAARVQQRHKHLLATQGLLAHIVLDDGVATRKPVLILQALEDALAGVVLLARAGFIVVQDLVNQPGEPRKLGPPHRLSALVARRHRESQGLLDRLAVHAKPLGGLPDTQAIDVAGTS